MNHSHGSCQQPINPRCRHYHTEAIVPLMGKQHTQLEEKALSCSLNYSKYTMPTKYMHSLLLSHWYHIWKSAQVEVFSLRAQLLYNAFVKECTHPQFFWSAYKVNEVRLVRWWVLIQVILTLYADKKTLTPKLAKKVPEFLEALHISEELFLPAWALKFPMSNFLKCNLTWVLCCCDSQCECG